MRKHLLAPLSVELKMHSSRNASVTSEIATDADYTRKLKLCFAVKLYELWNKAKFKSKLHKIKTE